MRDILPGNQAHEDGGFVREKGPRSDEWKRSRKGGIPEIKIGRCFSQRRGLKHGMIDLDSTSVDIQRNPPTINKELYAQRVGNGIESPPPDVIVFRNYSDIPEYSVEEQYSKSSDSPTDYDYEMERTEGRSDDEICNGGQVIVKVDPKTPPLLPSPENEPDKEEMWNDPEPRSPNSVIIKVEPRTPSPIAEEEPDDDKERDVKPPTFLSGKRVFKGVGTIFR